jgi:hypothetical protein
MAFAIASSRRRKGWCEVSARLSCEGNIPGSSNAGDFHRGPVRAKSVRHENLWATVPLHRPLQKRERSLAIPPFRGEHLQSFTFAIHGAPGS